MALSIVEQDCPPVFRLRVERGSLPADVAIETIRPGGARQAFPLEDRDGVLQSVQTIPEPHAFTAQITVGAQTHAVVFEEHDAHGAASRDNNMRAAVVHVVADAAVSVLVIVGLLLARAFGWLWMDPLAGIIGAGVIASWAAGLVRDTGAILLDMNPDAPMAERVRQAIEADGDRLTDFHLWRLGPGHLGAIVAVITAKARAPGFYRARLRQFPSLSHVTIEVEQAGRS